MIFCIQRVLRAIKEKFLQGNLEINQPVLRPVCPAEGVVEEQVEGRETPQALQSRLTSSHLHKTAPCPWAQLTSGSH